MEDQLGTWLSEIVPLLQVGDMPETLEYFQERLGFSLDYVWPSEGPAKWAGVSRGGIHFMLTIDLGTSTRRFIAEKGNGVVFYIIADDIEALYAELLEREAIVAQDLVDFGGRKQFSVAESNGYVIAFTEPFTAR